MTQQMIIHLSTLNCLSCFILYTGWCRMTEIQNSFILDLFMRLKAKEKQTNQKLYNKVEDAGFHHRNLYLKYPTKGKNIYFLS